MINPLSELLNELKILTGDDQSGRVEDLLKRIRQKHYEALDDRGQESYSEGRDEGYEHGRESMREEILGDVRSVIAWGLEAGAEPAAIRCRLRYNYDHLFDRAEAELNPELARDLVQRLNVLHGPDPLAKISEAMSLMNSMILCGENHSAVSLKALEDARQAVMEIAKQGSGLTS